MREKIFEIERRGEPEAARVSLLIKENFPSSDCINNLKVPSLNCILCSEKY